MEGVLGGKVLRNKAEIYSIRNKRFALGFEICNNAIEEKEMNSNLLT